MYFLSLTPFLVLRMKLRASQMIHHCVFSVCVICEKWLLKIKNLHLFLLNFIYLECKIVSKKDVKGSVKYQICKCDIPGDGDKIQSPTIWFAARSPLISLFLNNVSRWKWRGTSTKMKVKMFSVNTILYSLILCFLTVHTK